MESKAASLRIEALQCLTICLAGTDTKAFWDLMMMYFGSESYKDNVWGFIDPKSCVARPLDLESTDEESEEEEGETEGATASTSAAAPKPVIPHSAKIIRVDVCPIDEAARMYPADEKSYSSTGVPKHLIAEWEAKTSGSSGASMYTCVHPKCDPPFIAKGGTTSLFTHVRRHHLGVCLACLYCPHKLFYSATGWRDHMRGNHSGVPWFCAEVDIPEEAEAAQMLSQLQADPTSLRDAAQHHDPEVAATMPSSTDQPGIKDEPPEEETDYMETVYDDDQEDDPLDEEPEIRQDIEFLPTDTVERPEPPTPTHGHFYGGLAPWVADQDPSLDMQIQYRVYHADTVTDSAPPSRKPKEDPE